MKRAGLAERRKAVGLSQERLAEILGIDRSTVVRWERADTEPQPWQRPRLAKALKVSSEELAVLLADVQNPATADVSRGAFPFDDPMVGLDLLRRGLDLSVATGSLTIGQVEELAFGVEANARQCLQAPPLEMLRQLVFDLATVRQHMKVHQPLAIQQGLYQVAAQLSVLIADELMVLGDHRQSRAWHGTARLLADQTNDVGLRANVRALAALLPLYYGDPLEAVRLAEDAELLVEGRPYLASALAPMYRAVGLGQLNATSASNQALNLARERVQALAATERTDSVFGLAEQRWQFYQGRILSGIGKVEEAWAIHEQALTRYPEDVVGDPALILFDRSISLVRSRQVTNGCALAEQTLLRLPEQHRTGIFLRAASQVLDAVPAGRRNSTAASRYRETLRGCAAIPA